MKSPTTIAKRFIINFCCIFLLVATGVNTQAQTNPTAQNLTYSQNFGTTTFSVVPTGIAAWTVESSPIGNQSAAELSSPIGNEAVIAATTTQLTGGCYGYAANNNGRFYIQTSTDSANGTNQLATAIVTTNMENIRVSYNVEMISAQAKTIGVILQYRIGTIGSWTTVSGSVYAHNNSTRSAGQIDNFIELNLPVIANDKSVVQLRWATWCGSEIGNYSGIGIDNISITGVQYGPITTCSEELIVHPFSGASFSGTVVVSINLPPGVIAINSANLSPYTNVVVVDTSDLYNPTYTFTAPDTSFTLSYYVKADCETFDESNSTVYFNITNSINALDTVTDAISISSPWIIFHDSSSTNFIYNNAFIDSNYTRTLVYKNTGATFTGDLLFLDTIPNFYSAAIQFVSAVDSVYSGTASIISSTINDSVVQLKINMNNFASGGSLFIKEVIKLINCPNGNNNHTYFSAFYGCTDDTLCAEAQTTVPKTTTNEDVNDKPILDYTLLTKGYPDCWKDAQERIIKINNKGLSAASEVQLWFPLTTNDITENSLDSFEIYHFDSLTSTKTSILYSDTIIAGEHWITTLDSLAAGDSLFFRYFEIINCIDSSNYDNFFNTSIKMHYEGFPYVNLIHSCKSTELQTVHQFSQNQYIWRSWEHDSKLQQTFYNYIGTMNGGDSVNFEVSSSNLVVAGIYGTNTSGFIFNIPNSEIQIELQLDSALGLVTDSLYLFGNIGGIPTAIYPDSIEYFLGLNPLIGGGDKMIAHFAIPDSFYNAVTQPYMHGIKYIQPSPELYFSEFFSSFKVKFRLRAYCEYMSGAPSAIVERFFFVPDKLCSPDCKIPLAKVEDAINVHCPGCLFPGWNISAFDIQRTNFDFADNNNNNFPDIYPLQPADTNLVKIKNVMVKDTLECTLTANTSNGDGALMFDNIGVDYQYAQLLLQNSRMGNLQFLGATGTFTDTNGVYSFTIPSYAGKSSDSTNFYLDLSIDSLKIYSGDTSLTQFWSGNNLTIRPTFAVVKNFTQPYFNIEAINSILFMAGTPFTGVMTKPDAFNYEIDSLSAMTDSMRSELAFWCTGYEGRYGAIGTDEEFIIPKVVHDASGTPNYYPCKNVLRYEMNTEVGSTVLPYAGNDQAAWNSFSFELRNLWMLDSIHINYPNGYELDSVVMINSQLTSDGVGGNTVRSCYKWTSPAYHIYNMNNAIVNPTSATIYPASNLTQLTADTCAGPNNANLKGWDEAKQYVILFILKNTVCDTPLVYPTLGNYPITTYWSNFPTATNGDTVVVQTLGNFEFNKPDAGLTTNINSFIQDAPNSDLMLNITVNTVQLPPSSSVDAQVTHSIAENTFLMIHSPSNNVVIDSIVDIPSNQRIYAINFLNNDSLYGLGNVGFVWGAANFNVFAHYNCANIEVSDSILIYTGWNCNGYPDSLQPLNTVCYLDSVWKSFNIIKPGLQASLSVPDTAAICDTLHYDVKLTATGTGSLDSVTIWMPNTSGLFSFLSGSGQLVYNGNTFITPTGLDTLSFVLSDSNLLLNFEQGDTAHFLFDVIPDCNFYTSTDKVQLFITAINYCGNRLDTIFLEKRPDFIELPEQDSLLVELLNDTISGCNESATINIIVTNVGSSVTGSLNTVTVDLPTGFVWNSGNPFTSVNGQTYTFNLDSGMISGATQTIQFTTSDNVGNGVYNTIATVWLAQEIICGGDTCIFAQSLAAYTDTAQLTVINRDLILDSSFVIAACLGDSTGSIDITVVGGTLPYTYSWVNSSATSYGTTEDLTSLPADAYTVTVTDSTNCSFTDTFTVAVDSNCVTLCDSCSTILSGTITLSPPLGQTYCINSTISIAGLVDFTLSNFKIAPNMSIVVAPGAVLTIKGSHLYSCDDMWQGIVVKPGGRVVVQSFVLGNFFNRSSFIEDAFIAIDVLSNSTITNNPLTVTDATFNRNQIGIQIADYSTNTGPLTYQISITNTVFTCRDIPFTSGSLVWTHTNTIKGPSGGGVLESPYINNITFSPTNPKAYLKPPFVAGTKPLAGIRLIRVGDTQTPLTPVYHEMKIGTTGNPKFNVFDNLMIGIDAHSSNFTCVNNVFQNNPENPKLAVAINAIAENLTVNRLRVMPAVANNFTNRFYDVGRAIHSVDYFENIATRCEVRSSHVTNAPALSPVVFNGKYGFVAQTNRFKTINFSNNTMYNIENGITFLGSYGPLPAIIPPPYGQYSGQVDINNNVIRPNLPTQPVTTQYVANAISVSNVLSGFNFLFAPNSTVHINNNTLTDVYRGIGVSSWRRKDVKTNDNIILLKADAFTVTNPTPLQYGIAYQVNSAASTYGNTIIGNKVTGFGITANQKVRAIIASLCVSQIVSCNEVKNTFKGIEFNGDNHLTSFTRNSMTNHRYGFVLDNAGFIGVQGNSTTPSDNQWLGAWTAPNYKTATLGGSTAIGSTLWVRPSLATYNPNGSGTSTLAPIPSNMYSNANGTLLYITNNPAMTACTTSLPPCCNGNGKIARMEQVVQEQELLVNNIAETRYINKNKVYRMLRAEPDLLDSSTILQDFYAARLISNSETMAAVEDDFMQRDIVAGQAKAANITAENSIEQNYLTFFDSYLKQQTATITTSDSLNIATIAMGCPFTDGEVVYQARALFNAIYMSNVLFEDNCSSENAKNSFGFYEEVKTIISTEKSGPSYNLVPNYDFEFYTACPTGPSQLPLAAPWTAPTNNSSEYYNSCVSSSYYSVPFQQGSFASNFQEAHSGQGFSGLIVYNAPGANYREYGQNQLTETLQAGQCYYVEFFVNRTHGNYGGKYAINNMGCHFTNSAFTTTSFGDALNLTPDILKFGNPIITDTVNWTPISGIFVANGTENYITMGNFANDIDTDTLDMLDDTYPSAVYFIEDVSVLPIDSMPGGMPAYAGVDTNVILGDSVFIGQQISNLNCNWYNATGGLIASGTSGIYVNPTATTTFVVEQELCGNLTYDTVKVSVTTSINELLNENNVQIYPNPTTGETTLEIVGGESNEWLMAVLDVQGRTVIEKLFNGNKIELKLALDNGIYLVRITNKNTDETVIKKLIINR